MLPLKRLSKLPGGVYVNEFGNVKSTISELLTLSEFVNNESQLGAELEEEVRSQFAKNDNVLIPEESNKPLYLEKSNFTLELEDKLAKFVL